MPTRRYVFAGVEVTVCCVQGSARGRQLEETDRCFKLNPDSYTNLPFLSLSLSLSFPSPREPPSLSINNLVFSTSNKLE